jgi:outer membrane protein
MKRFSIVLNVILVIAVAVLYYLHFSSSGSTAENMVKDSDTLPDINNEKTANSVKVTSKQSDAIIVYVNFDTLLAKYKYYKKVSAEIERNLTSIEGNFKARVMKYQKDVNEYMKNAEAGILSKEQAMQIENELTQRKTAIENDEKNLSLQQEKETDKLRVVEERIYDFFKAFTKARNYSCVLTYTAKGQGALGVNDDLDVTNEVIDALNSEYEEEIKKKTK